MSPRLAVLGLLAVLAWPGVANAAGDAALELPYWSVTPFAGLLLAIAFFPLLAEHFWHSNLNKAIVVAVFAVPMAAYLSYVQFAKGQPALLALAHEIEQYVSFIILLGSLYVVAGGILLTGDLTARPLTNVALLTVGVVLANFIGTTGASVLLIRALLRVNQQRRHKVHLPIFFIFTVSNLGGLLTPLGDPPLFLGFLNDVPFFWTLSLWQPWLVANGIVLAMFLVWDVLVFRREGVPEVDPDKSLAQPLRLRGLVNLPLLAGILAAVLLQGHLSHPWGEMVAGALMLGLGGLSLWLTPVELRQANAFTWEPMTEVAILFAGIFITMVPALAILQLHGKELGVSEPWEYFWLTGGLSSMLDNAPTYLTFATMAAGSSDFSVLVRDEVTGMNGPLVLSAISCGAVFMGALTYVGNGPNFMVKAIAKEAGYPMPSFFGYVSFSYTLLLPVFALITLLFFWPR
jgi:Na+/H+ antiporter NhaD/arsenite permease-like protein